MNMKVASVLVKGSARDGDNDFRGRHFAGDRKARFRLLKQCAKAAIENECAALVLPAGFFAVSDDKERVRLEQRLKTTAGLDNLILALGIDVLDEQSPKGGKKRTAGQSHLPYYGYVLHSGRFVIGPVAQVSSSTSDGLSAEEAATAIKDRVAKFGNGRRQSRVALAICGEVLSSCFRNEINNALDKQANKETVEDGPAILFHIAHASVQLGGSANESWESKVSELIDGLPLNYVWAFSDHIMALEHFGNGKTVDLVRGNAAEGGQTRLTARFGLGEDEDARMYVYECTQASRP